MSEARGALAEAQEGRDAPRAAIELAKQQLEQWRSGWEGGDASLEVSWEAQDKVHCNLVAKMVMVPVRLDAGALRLLRHHIFYHAPLASAKTPLHPLLSCGTFFVSHTKQTTPSAATDMQFENRDISSSSGLVNNGAVGEPDPVIEAEVRRVITELRESAAVLADGKFNTDDFAAVLEVVRVGVSVTSNMRRLSGAQKKTVLVMALQELCTSDTLDDYIPMLVDFTVVVRKEGLTFTGPLCCCRKIQAGVCVIL